MKKITFIVCCLSLFLGAKAQTFSDGFEADTVGKLGPQSPYWTTWHNDDGSDEDVTVIDSVNHTPGGTKSIYFYSDNANGGPTDCILPISKIPLTTGNFKFDAWFKIPKDKMAYFNFQGDTINGDLFTFECEMDTQGGIQIKNTGNTVLTSAYPVDTWFKLTIEANLNINSWSLSIDGVLKGKWKNEVAQITAIDFFPPNTDAKFWVDDVSFTITPYVLPVLNGAANAASVPVGLVWQPRNLTFTAHNLGVTAITSFDVAVSHNGAKAVNETVTGLNIASYEKKAVILKTPFTLAPGENKFTAIISNVNGAGKDGDAIDDTTSTITVATQPAAGKMILAEEVTGTWCGFCPRGAVFMNRMVKDYPGHIAPVSAHLKNTANRDTMALDGYASTLGITSYPRIFVDRADRVDPRAFENNFLLNVTAVPEGFLVNGAAYNPATRELKVSITTTLQNDISGDYRVACVITEDSVSGTVKEYDQANSYSGGGYGEMGGFELLDNPVPAAQMNYNFVARAFSPTPKGLPNAYGTTALKGQIITHNFVYTLPLTWDVDQLHIVGVMMDASGLASNASYTTIKEATKNGYISGIVVGMNELADAPDAIQLVPNPASDVAAISLNLKKEALVTVQIYNATGSLVASKEYGRLTGSYHLPVEIQQLATGMYVMRVNIDNQPTVLKLIKE